MKILVMWEPCPGAQLHEDGYQDSRQVIMRDDFRRVYDNEFGKLVGTRVKDVRRNEQDDIIFELEEAVVETTDDHALQSLPNCPFEIDVRSICREPPSGGSYKLISIDEEEDGTVTITLGLLEAADDG